MSATDYERELFERVARWREHPAWTDLTEEVLRHVAEREGIDFATALLYERLRQSPRHGPFIAQLDGLPSPSGRGGPARLDATLVVVPGAFYVEFPHTGADGRLLREVAAHFGCPTHLIPLASLGSLADNARTIRDWLAARPDGPIILVSLSKGGADVKQALAEAPQAFRNVVVWINLCGLVHGTPLVSWLFARRLRVLWYRLLFWFRGYNFEAIRELDRALGGRLDPPIELPEHLHVLHVVGFPLERHLTSALARRCFRRLRPLGPNDGAGIMLADLGRLPGLVYPVWGADHYLRPAWGDVRTIAVRILHYLCDEWERLTAPSRSNTPHLPTTPSANPATTSTR